MPEKAPWEHVERWRDAREDILELLDQAVELRDGVIDALDHPHDDAMSRGVAFYVRWRGTLRDLSKTHPHVDVVHFQRGVFSLYGVPLRLYRAYAEDEPPARVLEISKQERKAIQMSLFENWEGEEQEAEELPIPDARFRIRAVPDEDNRIAEFVFEQLNESGDVTWDWAIRAEDVPVALADASTHLREPVRQEAPKVGLRPVDDESTADGEE